MLRIINLSVLVLVLLIAGSCKSFATQYLSCAVNQVDGPLEASDVNQKLLRVGLLITNGGGAPTCSGMTFNFVGVNEIQSASLYYTATNNTYTSPTLLQTITNPSSNQPFTFSAVSNPTSGQTYYYWLLIDMKTTVTNNTIIDASYVTGSYTALNGGFTVTTPDPIGFRFTNRMYKVGTGEHYPNIYQVASAISRFDYDGSDSIFFEMTSNYLADAEAPLQTIQFLNHSGPAFVVIRPELGQTGKFTQADAGNAAIFIYFGGADKIVFDGRPGGTGTAGEWTIRNTRTAVTVGSTMVFREDATYNKFKYLSIEGEGGIVSIETSTLTSGNDNLVFDRCKIGDLTAVGSSALPPIGINSNGTAGRSNDLITITNCEFVDIFNPVITANNGGIVIVGNSTSFSITNNHFYYTSALSNLNTNPFAAINIIGGSNYVVTGNYIGGSSTNCAGTAMSISSGTAALAGIKFSSSVTGSVTVSANTISNITYTTTCATAGVFPFIGIDMQGAANYTCGTLANGNTIGSMSVTGNIVLTHNAASGSFGYKGISYTSTGTGSLAYNNIGGITLNGSYTSALSIGIHLNHATGTATVDNNTVGGSVSNSILISSDNQFSAIASDGAAGLNATNNVIQNVTHNASTKLCGIIYNTNGVLTCTGNTIQNISTTSGNASFGVIIHQPSGASGATVSSNIIENITLNNAASSPIFYGIMLNSTASITCNDNIIGGISDNNMSFSNNNTVFGIHKSLAGSLTCNNNTIQEFNLTNTGVGAQFFGIYCVSGILSASGNSIRNVDCASTNASLGICGIYCYNNSTTHAITGNTIENFLMSTSGATNVGIIGVSVGTGSGSITKNYIRGLNTNANSISASLAGIYVNSGSWDVFNNVVFLDNSTTTNSIPLNGIYIEGTNLVNVHHNTVSISGSVSAGTASTSAFYNGCSGIVESKNNIWQNLRTGTGAHYAIRLGGIASFGTDNNFIEVANNQNQVCYYASDNTFAAWESNSGATADLNGSVTLDASGYVTTNPFIGAGLGDDLVATVPDDKDGISRGIACWMGAYEGQNITTSAITPTGYCAGASFTVSYTIGGNGTFNGGNIFTVQLSDAAGSFASPTNIGTVNSSTSGTINVTIPGGTPDGSVYLIRVISSDPIITGSDNSSPLTISGAAPSVPTATSATSVACTSFSANWNTVASVTNYFLDVAYDAGFTSFVTGYNDLNVSNVVTYAVTVPNAGTTYYYRVRASNNCGTTANSNTISATTTGTPGTYVVTSTANGTTVDGVSLRWAITQANANCGHDIIQFNLGGAGPYTINVTTTLPSLTDNSGVTINGWENNAFDGIPNTVPVFDASSGNPMDPIYQIILGNGNNVATGLTLASNNNVIKGLVMQDFGDGTPSANDVAITISGNNNSVLGCFIGLDATGTTRGTKTFNGIRITGANNQIGDGTAAGANVISGMNTSGQGINITTASATGNTVKGNIIGLQKNGTSLVAGAVQRWGVFINTSAVGNTIGGSNIGEGNVISGQNAGGDNYGVDINTTSGTGNTVKGNIIGLCADGVSYVASNTQKYGVLIDNSPNNVVGGNTDGDRNIISGNESYGMVLYGSSANGNSIKGNYIGTDETGTSIVTGSTQDKGIMIWTDPYNNTIGGTGAGDGNVISGNNDGVSTGMGVIISSPTTGGNTVVGNIIGPQKDGITYLTSNAQAYGVYIGNSSNNVIGGNTAGARNIISGNELCGVYLSGAATTTNYVRGNYIGTTINGNAIVTGSSQNYGVQTDNSSSLNIIGGSSTGEGNLISGNATSGVYLLSNNASGNTVIGNIIGPQANGLDYIPLNQTNGIEISDSPNNTIGGNTVGQRNIISANESYGVYISGASATGNIVKGNYIGIDNSGTSIIAGSGQDRGVFISTSATSNTIGGDATAGEGNVISGNSIYGIITTSTAGNTVVGNIIGPQADGTSYVASNSQIYGIEINGSPNNTIGGNTAGDRNIISANESYGISLFGAACSTNVIKGNYIGLDKNGTTFIAGSSQDCGVAVAGLVSGNTIGGSGANEGNVISGNKNASSSGRGISITSTAAGGNTIVGNIIGPQSDGVTYVASNGQYRGIEIDGSPNNIIGGNTAGSRNIVSANETYGIYLTGASSTGNLVKGNYLGTSSSLSTITGSSQDYGVYFSSSASNNKIGTTLVGSENTIAHNTVNGIYMTGTATTGNQIARNSIYENGEKPIELNYGPSQANAGIAPPSISSVSNTLISGTSNPNDTIYIFKNNGGTCYDAYAYHNKTTADGSGNWSLATSFSPGDKVMVLATNSSSNSSEFSSCTEVIVDLYWIGDGGNWNETSHWSYFSGGATAGISPEGTIVNFDGNSFTGSGIIISVPAGTHTIKGINFLEPSETPVLTGDGEIIIQP